MELVAYLKHHTMVSNLNQNTIHINKQNSERSQTLLHIKIDKTKLPKFRNLFIKVYNPVYAKIHLLGPFTVIISSNAKNWSILDFDIAS